MIKTPRGVQVPVQGRYEAMRNALNATGRPILYSICEWGSSTPWLWAPQVCCTTSAPPSLCGDSSRVLETRWDTRNRNLLTEGLHMSLGSA